MAVLGTLGFPEGSVPDGFAIPFSFYDEFMRANEFYDDVREMLADLDFQADFDIQDDRLDELRDDIKDAPTPQRLLDALTAMHATYPEGQSLRYRSSTNNEDLPGFNGAGLYDSKTQDPDETEEDGIDKSLKGVYASLWTFRAFTEREFHRVDHLAAAMGVLVHPNFKDEKANGVAVSFDPTAGREGYYYVNTQVGEDLVTNPEAHSVPEELLLGTRGRYRVLSTSNLVEPGELLLSHTQQRVLRERLSVIHDHFEGLYSPVPGDAFAMEIEFKITSEDVLAIKQARPWVFGPGSDDADDADDDGDQGPPTAAVELDAECSDICRARTGLPVTFTDASAGSVRSRTWDFGDGTSARGGTAEHAWSEPGFYEVVLWVSDGTVESSSSLTFLVEASEPAGTCLPDTTTRCLQNSRYAAEVEWRTANGAAGAGIVVHAGTNDSGLFRFFGASNWEVLIKVLDGCALNGHMWVFGASTTDLGYSIEVTDTVTETVRKYGNEPGKPAPAIADSEAFAAVCPP